MVPPTPQYSTTPAEELIHAIVIEADLDATRVLLFLKQLGYNPTPENPLSLPSAFLLDLGAALRLREWVRDGLLAHEDFGLPEAEEALATTLYSLNQANSDGTGLANRLLKVFAQRFAWHGRREWGAAVALDTVDDDAALDALAAFLWDHRHDGSGRGPER